MHNCSCQSLIFHSIGSNQHRTFQTINLLLCLQFKFLKVIIVLLLSGEGNDFKVCFVMSTHHRSLFVSLFQSEVILKSYNLNPTLNMLSLSSTKEIIAIFLNTVKFIADLQQINSMISRYEHFHLLPKRIILLQKSFVLHYLQRYYIFTFIRLSLQIMKHKGESWCASSVLISFSIIVV